MTTPRERLRSILIDAAEALADAHEAVAEGHVTSNHSGIKRCVCTVACAHQRIMGTLKDLRLTSTFVIQGPITDDPIEGFPSSPLYWSNDWGWGSREGATEFPVHSLPWIRLPDEWVTLRWVREEA